MPEQPVRINLTNAGTGTVEVGGHEIGNHIRSLNVRAEPGEIPIVQLDVLGRAGISIEAQAKVALGPNLLLMLGDLGWTAPTPEPTDG